MVIKGREGEGEGISFKESIREEAFYMFILLCFIFLVHKYFTIVTIAAFSISFNHDLHQVIYVFER